MPHLNLRRPRSMLAAILVTYTLLAVLFAIYTPPWQAPDEPAHYNYVRYLVDKGQFPVLQMGDYSQGYLDWIKEARFAPILSIDPIRYEFHQPPLYYLLAAPLFAVTGGALLPLRLFSVLLGAGLVSLAYLIGRRLFPTRPALGLAAAAFVAFLPQHLATVAQVGNDALAELLVGAVLALLAGWVTGDARQGPVRSAQDPKHPMPVTRRKAEYALLGVLCGLVLVTKTTAYVAVLLAGGVLLWEWWRERATLSRMATELGLVVLPAALISFPWYLRDILTYGWPDFLGLARHDSIVVGQMRLADYLSRFGWSSYAQRLVTFTFDSFWGVFGWQGVPMDSRVYTALAIFSCAAGLGLLVRIALRDFSAARPALALCALCVLLSVLVYAWYNLQFVQHQGRYLFTALIPLALAVALGWEEALRPELSRVLAAGLALLTVALLALGVLGGQGLPKWPVALAMLAAVGFAVRPWLPRRMDGLLFALPYVALPLLALYGLFGAIVPQLALRLAG